MLLIVIFTQRPTAPCRSCGRASDGHEPSSLRLAWPSVATRNGLASPARTGAPRILNFGLVPLLGLGWPAANSHRRLDAPRRLGMQLSQQPVAQVHLMTARAHLHQADLLAAKGFPNKTQPPAPPDLPVASHLPHRPTSAIDPPSYGFHILALGSSIQARGGYLAQRFMRPLLIELSEPAIKTSLLGRWRVSGGPSRLRFERPMHPLVRPIFLWTTRRNKLHSNAQTEPPHAQRTQAARTLRAKRWAIIHPNRLRLTVPLEPALKLPLHSCQLGLDHHLTAQDITAEPITGRQRIAALAVATSKPSFEVHRPHLIGLVCHPQRYRLLHRTPAPSASPAHQTRPDQHPAQRAGRRQTAWPIALLQFYPQLLGPPVRVAQPQSLYPLPPLGRALSS